MRPFDMPFHPGNIPANRGPLARYFPPVPAGVATAWLKDHIAPGSWILDPFGTSPSQALEMAAEGYRVLVTVNNPITSFVIKTLASAPNREDLRAAIADLAMARKGEDRLERFIQALYTVDCPGCNRPIQAKTFIWQRQAERPDRCLIDCPHCGLSGEQPVSPSSLERLSTLLPHAIHSRARALERVAPMDDPIRPDVEQALQCYLPRPLYVLFSLLNQIEKLPTTPERLGWLTALVLTVCDEGNTLWPYPTLRSRPRHLVVPASFRENNLWIALEEAIDEWQTQNAPIHVTYWPQLPPTTGGICLFQGRVRDLTADLAEHQIIGLSGLPVEAIVTVFPRPNQAFWTLSALWAGWLWGREAVTPLKSALARQRYDWNWHTSALSATLSHLSAHSGLAVPFWGFISEVEPAFLSAVVAAADISNLKLEGLALRHDVNQAELLWSFAGTETSPGAVYSEGSEENAITQALEKRGEAAPYLVLYTAATAASAARRQFRKWAGQKEQTVLQEHQASLQRIFNETGQLVRYGGGQHSLETAIYWSQTIPHGNPSLSDQIEKEIVQTLIANPVSQFESLDRHLCRVFPGLDTPPRDLIQACLESYGEQHPTEINSWQLRRNELPSARREELIAIQALLRKTGAQLNYTIQGTSPLLWLDQNGQITYEFHIMASAIISRCVLSSQAPPQNAVIAIPGSRANLIIDKLHRDPWLNEKITAGWTFLKFRHLRYITSSMPLTRSVWEEWLPRDPLESKATQLEMF